MFNSFWHSYVINLRWNEDRIWNLILAYEKRILERIDKSKKEISYLTFISFEEQQNFELIFIFHSLFRNVWFYYK